MQSVEVPPRSSGELAISIDKKDSRQLLFEVSMALYDACHAEPACKRWYWPVSVG